jgi:hypothetical protein
LSRGYVFPVGPDSLFITSGASMGLHLICTLFTCPGDIIFIEEPTYFYALRIFADHDLRLVPIRTDENGLVINSLKKTDRVLSEISLHHPHLPKPDRPHPVPGAPQAACELEPPTRFPCGGRRGLSFSELLRPAAKAIRR